MMTRYVPAWLTRPVCIALAVFPAVLLAATSGAAAAPTPSPQLRLAQGVVRGVLRHGIDVFRAIPYAAPPVGPLRFHAPAPPRPWSGVFNAIANGPSCPQRPSADPAGQASTDEDCLRLNVFAPAVPAASPRPVMVWIHGGGFVEGFSGAPQYNPTTLVKEGGVVVVSVNYRLGILGLLATSGLDQANGQPSGNFGILDQQAALGWVHRNIAAFGGDPRNVTIFGESAGANSVLALVASPLSAGLFQKAIAESATDNVHAAPRAAYERSGDHIAAELGCPAGAAQVACLRRLPVSAILKLRASLGFVQGPGVFPLDPFQALRRGSFNRVPMIIGSNLHEGYLFVSRKENDLGHALSAAEYPGEMQSIFGPHAAAAMTLYPLASAPSPAAAAGNAETDIRFSCYMNLARVDAAPYVPVYGYEMNEPAPAQQQPLKKYSLASTSYHTSDLAYVFNFVAGGPLPPAAAPLGRKLRAYWIQFARTGSPNRPGLPVWPRFRPKSTALINLSTAGGLTRDFASRHRCPTLEHAGLVTN